MKRIDTAKLDGTSVRHVDNVSPSKSQLSRRSGSEATTAPLSLCMTSPGNAGGGIRWTGDLSSNFCIVNVFVRPGDRLLQETEAILTVGDVTVSLGGTLSYAFALSVDVGGVVEEIDLGDPASLYRITLQKNTGGSVVAGAYDVGTSTNYPLTHSGSAGNIGDEESVDIFGGYSSANLMGSLSRVTDFSVVDENGTLSLIVFDAPPTMNEGDEDHLLVYNSLRGDLGDLAVFPRQPTVDSDGVQLEEWSWAEATLPPGVSYRLRKDASYTFSLSITHSGEDGIILDGGDILSIDIVAGVTMVSASFWDLTVNTNLSVDYTLGPVILQVTVDGGRVVFAAAGSSAQSDIVTELDAELSELPCTLKLSSGKLHWAAITPTLSDLVTGDVAEIDNEIAFSVWDFTKTEGTRCPDNGLDNITFFTETDETYQAPFYSEADEGETVWNSLGGGIKLGSSIDGFTGRLPRILSDDAVVTSHGNKTFIVDGGDVTVAFKESKTFRPLGVPKPTEMVESYTLGIPEGDMERVARYAIRHVTSEGTKGPLFSAGALPLDGNRVFGTPSLGSEDIYTGAGGEIDWIGPSSESSIGVDLDIEARLALRDLPDTPLATHRGLLFEGIRYTNSSEDPQDSYQLHTETNSANCSHYGGIFRWSGMRKFSDTKHKWSYSVHNFFQLEIEKHLGTSRYLAQGPNSAFSIGVIFKHNVWPIRKTGLLNIVTTGTSDVYPILSFSDANNITSSSGRTTILGVNQNAASAGSSTRDTPCMVGTYYDDGVEKWKLGAFFQKVLPEFVSNPTYATQSYSAIWPTVPTNHQISSQEITLPQDIEPGDDIAVVLGIDYPNDTYTVSVAINGGEFTQTDLGSSLASLASGATRVSWCVGASDFALEGIPCQFALAAGSILEYDKVTCRSPFYTNRGDSVLYSIRTWHSDISDELDTQFWERDISVYDRYVATLNEDYDIVPNVSHKYGQEYLHSNVSPWFTGSLLDDTQGSWAGGNGLFAPDSVEMTIIPDPWTTYYRSGTHPKIESNWGCCCFYDLKLARERGTGSQPYYGIVPELLGGLLNRGNSTVWVQAQQAPVYRFSVWNPRHTIGILSDSDGDLGIFYDGEMGGRIMAHRGDVSGYHHYIEHSDPTRRGVPSYFWADNCGCYYNDEQGNWAHSSPLYAGKNYGYGDNYRLPSGLDLGEPFWVAFNMTSTGIIGRLEFFDSTFGVPFNSTFLASSVRIGRDHSAIDLLRLTVFSTGSDLADHVFPTAEPSDNALAGMYFFTAFDPTTYNVTESGFNNLGTFDPDWATDSVFLISGGSSGTTDGDDYRFPLGKHVAGVEILRGLSVSGDPVDGVLPEHEREALQSPLYVLRYMLRGSSGFIDDVPDAGLGLYVDPATGDYPRSVQGVFVWGNQVGLFGDPLEPSTLFFSEPGPFGWESYPSFMKLRLPIQGDDVIQSALAIGGLLYVLTRDSMTILKGSPAQYSISSLGGGVGASTKHCTVVWNESLFSYNGTLWVTQLGQGGAQSEDISQPIRHLLPDDPTDARLRLSAALQSLYLIDTSTGDALRFHLPTKAWTRETRSIKDLADIDGVANLLHLDGTVSRVVPGVFTDPGDTPIEMVIEVALDAGDQPVAIDRLTIETLDATGSWTVQAQATDVPGDLDEPLSGATEITDFASGEVGLNIRGKFHRYRFTNDSNDSGKTSIIAIHDQQK